MADDERPGEGTPAAHEPAAVPDAGAAPEAEPPPADAGADPKAPEIGAPAEPVAPEAPADRPAGGAGRHRAETLSESVHERLGPHLPVDKAADEVEAPPDDFNMDKYDADALPPASDEYITHVGRVDGPFAAGPNAVSVQVKLVTGERVMLRRYELTSDDLGNLWRRFVIGERFWVALEKLRDKGVLVIRGPDGSGRLTEALALLQRLQAEGLVSSVGGLVVPDGVPVEDVVSQPEVFPHGWGMVLELRDGADVANASNVESYRTAVRHGSGGYVVVLAPPAGDEGDSGYSVVHERPDPAAVLRKHLEAALPEEMFRDALTAEEVDKYLGQVRDLRQVVELASALADGLPKEKPVKDVVASLEPDWRVVARAAFENAGQTPSPADPFAGPRRQALRLAYATFDGLELVDVFAAAESLLGMLRLVEAPDSTPARPVFDGGLDKLLFPKMLTEAAAGDPESPRRAQLRHPALLEAFLDVAWNDFDTTREVLLYWLDRVVVSGRPAVRVRAAETAARLAAYDFEKVMAGLIRPWALHTSGIRRQAAAVAVEHLSRNPSFTTRVRGRVNDWVHSDDPELHDTAAKVYGTEVGRALPEVAMRDLLILARDPRQRAYRSVGRAVAIVYLPESAGLVFDHLGTWLDDRSPDVNAHARWALLFLARQLKEGWPRLLADAAKVPERQTVLARLWMAALSDPATSYPAWDLMRQWLELPQRKDGADVELTKALIDLVLAAVAGNRLRRRGLWHLRRWLRPRPADPLLTELIERLTEDRNR